MLFIKKKVLILGHSLGGFLGLNFAIKYPELIERLILVGIRKRYGFIEAFIDQKFLFFCFKMKEPIIELPYENKN